jgi:GDP-L-fucose synthase
MTEAKNTRLFDLVGKRVYVAGHGGMVGAALVRRLKSEACTILTADRAALDLTRRREFLAVDDLADACVFVLKHYSGSKFLNVGTGQDITIAEFAQLIADVIGYRGRFIFDTSRPDGTPQKLLNVSELTRLGWRAKTPLWEGIAAAYTDFLANGGQRRTVALRENANTNA